MDRSIATLELVGQSVALDFANTVNSRVATIHDYLGTYGHLAAWAIRGGTLSAADHLALEEMADRDPAGARRVLGRAARHRESIFEVFSAIATGRAAPPTSLAAVMRAYGAAAARATVSPQRSGAHLTWPLDDLGRPLRPVDYDAGRLLLSADVELVKECPGCRWLFLDRSRNRTRRWCDMQVCGSRSKMRRYYRARRPIDSEALPSE